MSLQQPRSGLQPNQLCQSCADNIFPDGNWKQTWKKEGESVLKGSTKYYTEEITRGPFNVDASRKASEAGCHFCSLVLEAICERVFFSGAPDPYNIQDQGYESCCSLYDEYLIHIRPKYHDLEVMFRKPGDEHFDHACRLKYRSVTATDRDEPHQYNHPNYGKLVQHISHTNLGELRVEQIKEWIQVYKESHPKCNASYEYKGQGGPIVRFIDFGTNSSQPAKLVDRHLAGADRPVYITLSYCWTPETVKSKMTRTNKDSYYEAVPATEWPEIYKDTASLACQLGVRYVWIDSLCIIQDDPMDWAERGQSWT